MLELTAREARRIAVRAQLLDAERPTDLLDVVRRLDFLQLEPTDAVAPSAEVVVWSRVGASFDRTELADAVDEQRLIDLHGRIRAPEDIALFRADMVGWETKPDQKDWEIAVREWVADNDGCRRDILERLRQDGPLPGAALPDTCVRPWRSSGWNNNRNVTQLLELMVSRGEVAAAGRDGRAKLWDLAERVYPDDPVVPAIEARRIRDEKLLQSLGICRPRMVAPNPLEPSGVGEAGERAVISGVKGEWRVDPAQLGRSFRGRAAILSPLDRLVFDRKRMVDLFGFDYQLEMYKPKVKRRWGYWAMPVLYGDRLVGKLDATADRAGGVLRVDALHRDVDFSAAMTRAVEAEIAELARWLRLDLDRQDG